MTTLRPTLAALVLLTLPFDLRAEDEAIVLRPQSALISEFPSGEATPAFISADRVSGHQEGEIEAEGEVELRKRGQTVNADHLTYSPAEDEVHAEGHVRIEQKDSITTGPELRMKLEERRGYMRTPVYQISRPDSHGAAENLEFAGENKYVISDGTYTTCGNDDWFIRTKEMELDRTTQVGTATHASVYFKGVPFLYSPWLTFPLNNQRKSGLLPPTLGSSGRSGVEFSLPYYWNIAPERDATITPRYLSKRGMQLSGEYRYLDPDYTGETRIEALPNDSIAERSRYLLSLRHGHNLGWGWLGALNVLKVSDDDYFRDLTTTLANTSQTNLPREGLLAFNGLGMSFLTRVQRFQTLQDPLAPVVPPYARAPQLLLNGNWRDIAAMDVGLTSEWVDFTHPSLVNGKRLTLYPNLSLPLIRSYAFLTPKIGVHHTRYTLGENNNTGLTEASRSLPIFSLDSGLFFERELELRGSDYIQTLEPRLYYLNIPYRDQSALPNFDSALADFNYSQMFTENQFVGGDRINDANQLTVALTSRLIDPNSGQEWLRAALGQRYYFKDQQVTLDGTARTDKSSDILATFSGRLARHWNLDTGIQYNPGQSELQKTGIGVRYQPELGKTLNLGYRFTRDAIEQADISAQWPLSGRWQGMGRWNYSFLDDKVLEGLAGLEYNGGCWAARMVMHRFATATAQASNSIFFQLELFGLGRIGSNPLDILKRNITGYAQTNQLSTPATTQ